MAEPPAKRQRLDGDGDDYDDTRAGKDAGNTAYSSLSRPISPPRKRRQREERIRIVSPFRLTTVRDLPDEDNVGAVSLNDLIGDPLIAELWDFNYLHDLDFLIEHLDEDTRALTQIHVVHGFWKREDPNRLSLQEQQRRHKNVTLHTAHMPEMFGTHHTKMLVLLRHDDTAQVVVHTANMIAKDWTNLTNGVWTSPLLPRLASASDEAAAAGGLVVGSGPRFKADLLAYLSAYNNRARDVCGALAAALRGYDFSAVRAALVASVPGKHDVEREPGSTATRWGWPALRETLGHIPVATAVAARSSEPSEIVVQVSSVATLGATDAWLQRTLFDSLAASCPLPPPPPPPPPPPLPSSSSSPPSSLSKTSRRPAFKLVFPTPDEIRRSLDGYASGASIRAKTQSATQARQLGYLRPLLHHWADDAAGASGGGTRSNSSNNNSSSSSSNSPRVKGDAGRKRAAPHIKTYIRYSSGAAASSPAIDWALLTSANVSKQAWGEATNRAGEVRIASWEVGVLVWPALLAGDAGARMVGTFKTDVPAGDEGDGEEEGGSPVVGLRMPYNLPLRKYGDGEVPWVATMSYTEADWMGRVWRG
ncbi:putative tyrosyl-DNA phosphodiesterase [Rosellinia necatrix]|uniref:Putative tyrosyl-DNA phosphodiesterase n=1 Tax=Rosellinia necatrix TaxID=77044 RepID=A0A1S7UI19_ROSNE|nr:putative tyrosyl-DNA phosphodiesterase [Rosellinia necatrix]